MEAEAVLNLLDTFWFHVDIFQQNSSKPNIISRSKSDEVLYVSSSPDSVLEIRKNDVVNTVKRKRLSKSLSELEFEEVKGFMDLGFVFGEDDKDSRLVEIIPGLQRSGHNEIQELRMRPYLSEAWGVNRNKAAAPILIMDWRLGDMSNDIGIKDSLKCWAHTVASALR